MIFFFAFFCSRLLSSRFSARKPQFISTKWYNVWLNTNHLPLYHFPHKYYDLTTTNNSHFYGRTYSLSLVAFFFLNFPMFLLLDVIFSPFGSSIMQIELLLSKYVSIVFVLKNAYSLAQQRSHRLRFSFFLFLLSFSFRSHRLIVISSMEFAIDENIKTVCRKKNERRDRESKKRKNLKWERQHQFRIVVLMKFSSIMLRISQMI